MPTFVNLTREEVKVAKDCLEAAALAVRPLAVDKYSFPLLNAYAAMQSLFEGIDFIGVMDSSVERFPALVGATPHQHKIIQDALRYYQAAGRTERIYAGEQPSYATDDEIEALQKALA